MDQKCGWKHDRRQTLSIPFSNPCERTLVTNQDGNTNRIEENFSILSWSRSDMLLFALFLPLVGGEGRAPPVVTEEQEEVVVVNTRTDVRLICPVRGHPTPLIEWSKVVSWCGVNLTLYKKQTFGVLLSLFLSHRKLCQFQLPQFPLEHCMTDEFIYPDGPTNPGGKKLILEKNKKHLFLFSVIWVP